MNTITATELRTKTPELVEALLAGYSVDFVHRSRIVGEIIPAQRKEKTFNARRFLKMARALDLPVTTPKQRDRIYRQHLAKKYGQSFSGR